MWLKALDLGSSISRCGGSSPLTRTIPSRSAVAENLIRWIKFRRGMPRQGPSLSSRASANPAPRDRKPCAAVKIRRLCYQAAGHLVNVEKKGYPAGKASYRLPPVFDFLTCIPVVRAAITIHFDIETEKAARPCLAAVPTEGLKHAQRQTPDGLGIRGIRSAALRSDRRGPWTVDDGRCVGAKAKLQGGVRKCDPRSHIRADRSYRGVTWTGPANGGHGH